VGQGLQGVLPIALITAHQLHRAHEETAGLLPDVADLWRMAGATGDLSVLVEAIRTSKVPESVLGDPVARMSLEYSLAPEIVREWVERFGGVVAEELCKASNTPAPTTIRVNSLRCTREECQAALAREGVSSVPTRFSPAGLILEKRVNAGALESYRGGMFEMQDEGSQIISMLASPAPGSVVVDACAGAGGKSLHMAALMQGQGTIHALDSDAARLRSLRARALRSGADIIRDAVAGVETDPAMDGVADVLLIDAPCSGVGTYRRNPGAKSGFSEKSSASLSELQSALLERYCRVVKPGGRLVYATCTLLRRENEDVVERFLEKHAGFHLIPAPDIVGSLGIPQKSSPYMLLLPHETGTDGFFAAVLERSGTPF
jgi:16S rRNA (cytosine967-C5)-methyltransferase